MCISIGSFLSLFYRRRERSQWRLKYCTAFSCFFAAAFVLKVPRFLRLPVFGFFLREYSRYLPDFSFLIIADECYLNAGADVKSSLCRLASALAVSVIAACSRAAL